MNSSSGPPLVTKQALEELNLESGKNVWAIFKATAVHVF
ncbi:MAG: TOBE domain-containing protein [Syntrophomonadaceae bacterium]|nr:TOBE domain-containing protein [Syntrophomonadaceae bacterium]